MRRIPPSAHRSIRWEWPSTNTPATARFVARRRPNRERTPVSADKVILCTGGVSRRLAVPGFELTSTHQRCLGLDLGPAVDAGHRGRGHGGPGRLDLQRVRLARPALPDGSPNPADEDRDVSAAVASAFRGAGVDVQENFEAIESFRKTPAGVAMTFSQPAPGKAPRRLWRSPRLAGWRIRRAEPRRGGRRDGSTVAL